MHALMQVLPIVAERLAHGDNSSLIIVADDDQVYSRNTVVRRHTTKSTIQVLSWGNRAPVHPGIHCMCCACRGDGRQLEPQVIIH